MVSHLAAQQQHSSSRLASNRPFTSARPTRLAVLHARSHAARAHFPQSGRQLSTTAEAAADRAAVPQEVDVVVVGAGLAGLNAAR